MEKEAALAEAMVKKHAKLEDDRRKRLAAERESDMRRPWGATELYEYARGRASRMLQEESGDPARIFEPQSFQKDALQAMSLYFTNSPAFEQLDPKIYNENKNIPFSLNKGLWLWSNPGQGKTLMMNMFSRNRRQCYRVVQCPKIVSGYVKNGDDHTEHYSRVIPATADTFNFFQATAGICYNDLGTEPPRAKHYGNDINVMEMIFLDSYERKVPFWHRHVTTNLTFPQVKDMYGERFVDRVRQMFNIIQIKGESLRK